MNRKMKYHDRLKLAELMKTNKTKVEIAKLMDISRRTLYYELERGMTENVYDTDVAQKTL